MAKPLHEHALQQNYRVGYLQLEQALRSSLGDKRLGLSTWTRGTGGEKPRIVGHLKIVRGKGKRARVLATVDGMEWEAGKSRLTTGKTLCVVGRYFKERQPIRHEQFAEWVEAALKACHTQ